MSTSSELGDYWSKRSGDFDAIYSGDRGTIYQWFDRLTRKNLRVRFAFAMEKLSPAGQKRILDVGCGSGRYCVELAAAGATDVIGVDLAEDMLQIARERAEQFELQDVCTFIQAEAMEYTAEEPFDGIIAMGVYDYVRNPLAFTRHVRELLRGQFLASFPSRWAARALPRKLWLTLRGCPLYFYTKRQIETLCEQSDLSCVSLRRSGPIYLLEARPRG